MLQAIFRWRHGVFEYGGFDLDPAPLILVAEDDATTLKLISAQLSRRGYEVATATNGQQALEFVQRRRPAAMVLDWLMPVMQGIEVCSRVKADPATSSIPVVILTSKVSEIDVEEGFRRGADEYITKPFDVAELEQVLQRVITLDLY